MGTVWEIDFYSRPILDDHQKKRWEILICEGAQSVTDQLTEGFRFSKFVSNQEVNSLVLKQTMMEAIAAAAAQTLAPPARMRFFRYQMQNMIIRACNELSIPTRVSRRTLALQQWLDERRLHVYPQEPGYQGEQSPVSSRPPLEIAKPLPDALLGQRWALASLPASDFAEMPAWDIDFGEGFPLALAGLAPETVIPGILIFSQRALPLAGWLSGLELASIKVQMGEICRLLLETGSTDTWILSGLNTPALQQEAQRFAEAKAAANQVHFLAVQDSPESQLFRGFWLLQERDFG